MTTKKHSSVMYQKTPLLDVTFQVTFPQNLQISSNPPVNFQGRIKNLFPNFSLTQDQSSYNFLSADQRWQLLLNRGFLAVVARQYEEWEAFQTHINLATAAVEIEYPPPYVSRIGLRFRNIIRRSVVGLTGKNWDQLLHNKWTGDLAWSGVAGAMKATHSEVVMGLNGGDDLVCVRHGLVPIAQPTQEMGYLIDHDFFVNGQFAMTEIAGKLREYHQAGQRFFKLWITDMLHQAMKPQIS
ncbi:MAG: hypothetical protein NPIRA06_28460 [Nitrospirales bacterium]|nr:MAG: hypothetical protein NPIRA06_28460 [Nitrospirales bacterium]